MPARDLRDQAAIEDTPVPETPPGPQLDETSLQLPLTTDQQRIALAIVRADFNAAKDARDKREFGWNGKGEALDFDKWLKELTDLYFGRRLPKTVPWKFCSNRSMMIAMAILETLHARIFPAVYNEELTRWRPTNTEDTERAERIEKLMYWWVRVHVKAREFFDRWVRYVIGYGTVVTETRWDVMLRDKGEEAPGQPQLDANGQPALDANGQPLLTAPQKVLDREESTKSTIIPISDVFWLKGAEDPQRDPLFLRRQFTYRELEELEKEGVVVNVSQPLDQDSLLLKDRLIVTEAPTDGTVPPEMLEELKNVRRRNLPVTCIKAYLNVDLDGDGFPEPVRLLVDLEHDVYLGGVLLKDISKRGRRPIDITQFLPRLDEPEGQLGIGALEQVKELALEIDAIFNQMTDANSLSVMRPGFYDPSGGIDAGALTLSPNKWTPINNPANSINVPQIDIPTERLLLAVRMVLEFIERLTAASSYIMGKESEIVGGSGTATRTEAIVGASNQRHAVPVMRLREGAARIMSTKLDLLQTNLPPGLEQRVLGENGEPLFHANEMTEEGLSGEYDAYLLPDESMGSKESERQLSAQLWAILMQSPIVAMNPLFQYKPLADVLKSYGREPELYLGPAPPPFVATAPEDEHTLIAQGEFGKVQVTPLQNPIEHMVSHMTWMQSPTFQAMLQTLSPEAQQQIVQFLQAHIQQHGQMMQALLQQQPQPTAGGAQNGSKPRPGGRVSAAPTVGPEPGVGSVQNPRAQAGSLQRTGESRPPTSGAG